MFGGDVVQEKSGSGLRQPKENGTGEEKVPLDTANAPSLANQEIADAPDQDALEQCTKVVNEIKAQDRRIEIRDVPAQTDYTKFLADLDVLRSALADARKTVRKAQMTRLVS